MGVGAVARFAVPQVCQLIHIKLPTIPHTDRHVSQTAIIFPPKAHPPHDRSVLKGGVAANQVAGSVSSTAFVGRSARGHDSSPRALKPDPARDQTNGIVAFNVGLIGVQLRPIRFPHHTELVHSFTTRQLDCEDKESTLLAIEIVCEKRAL